MCLRLERFDLIFFFTAGCWRWRWQLLVCVCVVSANDLHSCCCNCILINAVIYNARSNKEGEIYINIPISLDCFLIISVGQMLFLFFSGPSDIRKNWFDWENSNWSFFFFDIKRIGYLVGCRWGQLITGCFFVFFPPCETQLAHQD